MTKIVSAWKLEENELLRRRLGKLGEELGELISIKDRILIQGLNESDPKSGEFNYTNLWRECADVIAQIELLKNELQFNEFAFNERIRDKKYSMKTWEEMLINSEGFEGG